jgi:hypothetical protein
MQLTGGGWAGRRRRRAGVTGNIYSYSWASPWEAGELNNWLKKWGEKGKMNMKLKKNKT